MNMVKVRGKDIAPLSDEITREVNIGNDGRQFILRIPTRISNNSILKDFDKSYSAEVKINIKTKNQVVIKLKEGKKHEKGD